MEHCFPFFMLHGNLVFFYPENDFGIKVILYHHAYHSSEVIDMEFYSPIFEMEDMEIIFHLVFCALDRAIIVHIALLMRK